MSTILSFRDLEVWQLGMDLVIDVYRATDTFPAAERYGLTAQIRRAVISIPANVAEGHSRRAPRAYLNHVKIALGSQGELETEIEAALRLGIINVERARDLVKRIARLRQMLHGLRRALRRKYSALLAGATLLTYLLVAAVLR